MACGTGTFISASDARIKARGDKLINAEICAIQQKILESIDACESGKLSIVIKSGTPITALYAIEGLTIVIPGEGYVEDSPTISVTSLNGIDFSATLNINANSGAITGFTIINPGTDYLVGDQVTVTHSGGITGSSFVGEVANVGLLGEILSVTITGGGTNYFDAPHLNLIDPLMTGSGFQADLNLDVNGGIESIDIVEYGAGYSAGTAAVIWGNSTTTALLTVQTEAAASEVVVDPVYYHSAWLKLIDDPVVLLQLDTVLAYFKGKGYTIAIKTNPDTMNTIQWNISW